ncbi:UDP-N-acetylmuramate:L-alanyl-gamma-D-glutamyl-meso-diaminopimelate ligase [Aliiglaciecola lipolytica]|uniref:UDP-N-acetylmuramate:L-alanyl-gamma-D-glutamyl- meso-diaminopimelate ligase n=1 Tax=Aliiglaciecola lipolytica TaxID=477689 RepID=UPI001C0A11B3|nr:UDP-N-acetylmuramate:L-alanyl-gamma-D-glutamyl-meso-diaminopimelate ligase [Aliiglaciecola lipolytica]MBU2880241.1 UDP-N-acetylmuramate:L-alanyl-gamma-D-glutamyl-meso-diaminopimelate ligase [Aliiglaciecola lipolytica]
MHIHILGICGTFMGGIAAIAKSMGHHVSGSDANVYPPMSTQLESLGIPLTQGFDPAQLNPEPDVVIIGNAMSRGNPCVEAVLNRNLNYISGPQWLSENVLKQRWVIAASGTHGKTSTASMIAWVLEYAGLQPGFLIGGVPENFGISARLGESPFFVIEADEYDSAFFDKRSKFVHYHPRTLVLNNLEFDHADIFENLAAIQKQFHHLIRILPGNGLALAPANDENIKQVLEQGCWTPVQYLGTDWQVANQTADGSEFDVLLQNKTIGRVNWSLIGQHNIHNGIMAIAAARHAGVKPELAIEALAQFVNAKRRMETRGVVNDITVYDDFAHHPTAIATTIDGLRNKVKEARIFAVLEPRSATMKMGVHHSTLANSWKNADQVLLFQPDNLDWSLQQLTAESAVPSRVYASVDDIIETLIHEVAPGDHILIMSNGGFGGIHSRLLEQLAQHEI